jgi:4-hydroxybutyrate dehydrogenase / sulfolactaldehyde 3-reductase
MTNSIGFIGLGAMGLPMASNLVRKGFNVRGFDIDSRKIDELVNLGAKGASSVPETVQGVEIVITMLPATPHVEQVMFGNNGVLASIAPKTAVMDMSTIDPHETDRVAAACKERGIDFVDAPVGRLASHAARGESLFMVGADDMAFGRVEPSLNAMGTTIYRCGPPGSGARMKIVNNFLVIVSAQMNAEAITLGTKLGLDIDTMKAVFSGTTATNGQFQIAFASKTLRGDITPGFTIDLAYKDLNLAMAAAGECRVGTPLGDAAHAVLGSARGTSFASKDFSGLLDYACELAGITTPQLSS